MKNNKIIFNMLGVFGIAILIVVIMAYINKEDSKPGQYDEFASCIKESGAKFYGAFWCPHCRDQKKLFGNSAKLLPYEECSTPDAMGQLQVCIDKKIESYPTWEFADGTRVSKMLSLEEISSKTSCEINPNKTKETATN